MIKNILKQKGLNTSEIYENINRVITCKTCNSAISKSSVVAILTEWDEFKNLEANVLFTSKNKPKIFDGRNILKSKNLKYQIGKIV